MPPVSSGRIKIQLPHGRSLQSSATANVSELASISSQVVALLPHNNIKAGQKRDRQCDAEDEITVSDTEQEVHRVKRIKDVPSSTMEIERPEAPKNVTIEGTSELEMGKPIAVMKESLLASVTTDEMEKPIGKDDHINRMDVEEPGDGVGDNGHRLDSDVGDKHETDLEDGKVQVEEHEEDSNDTKSEATANEKPRRGRP